MRYLLLILCLLTGCQTQPDLIGHWHASTIYHDSNGFPNEEHYTFDILNDTLAAIRSRPPFWNGLLCTIDGEAQQISRHMGCLSFDWSYEIISENELAITDSYHKGDKAIKLLRKSGCDIETHLFMDAKLNIVLPETTINGIKPDDQSALQRHYCIGPASEKYASFYTRPFHY